MVSKFWISRYIVSMLSSEKRRRILQLSNQNSGAPDVFHERLHPELLICSRIAEICLMCSILTSMATIIMSNIQTPSVENGANVILSKDQSALLLALMWGCHCETELHMSVARSRLTKSAFYKLRNILFICGKESWHTAVVRCTKYDLYALWLGKEMELSHTALLELYHSR